MNGQKQLERIGILKKKVEEQEYFIRELRSALDGLTGITYDKDKVQTSVQGDPMLDKLCRIEEEEEKLKHLRKLYISWKIKMMQQIHQMEVGNLQRLLYLMYIEEHSLSEASNIMNWSYDHTRRQHIKAIENFELLTSG